MGEDQPAEPPTALDYGEWLEQDDGTVIKSQVKIHYGKDDYISGPQRVENGTVPINILDFDHSYGYDCRRYFNICIPDSTTIIFSSGSLIHFFDVSTGNVTFQRCSTGFGVGHIVKSPTKPHIAVGEIGDDPPVIIYEWPRMEIVTILKKGTRKMYSCLAYSPDGKLLLSQGGHPDYSITIWNWSKSTILLRCKSHEQEIYNAIFSPSIPGHLVTCGSGHIKFWKMSRTFTGLKLEGDLGKFGRIEISDIIALYSMPDEKVISGCEWGNILVWEEGLIKVEVRRKNNKPCHTNMITQFEFCNGDLMSIGMDGWIRVWSYETIDQADPSEDKGYIEIEPLYEFNITKELQGDDTTEEFGAPFSSMLMAMLKKNPEEPEDNEWYAQDGNGGLWLINLLSFDEAMKSNNKEETQSKQLLKCHAGAVMDAAVCSWSSFLATIGEDGFLHIYDYIKKKLVIIHKFNDSGSAALWLPCSLDQSGSTIICGFQSGVVRMLIVDCTNDFDENNDNPIKLIQVLKPHTSEVTAMTVNVSIKLLVTGSKDSTIFLLSIDTSGNQLSLMPIGFIPLPSGISVITWKSQNSLTVLIGCVDGHFGEIDILQKTPLNIEYRTTYQLEDYKATFFKFRSVKSAIRRGIMKQEIERKRLQRIEEMRTKMEEYKQMNPGVDIDEETFLADTEESPPLPDIYIPKDPNKILCLGYTNTGNIWLSMSGYDAGFIYEYSPIEAEEQKNIRELEPVKSTEIKDAEDLELQYLLVYNEKFLILGLEHGQLRVCHLNTDDYADLSDYWNLPMHDYSHGFIKKIVLSQDEKYLFTCGYDGNIFSFMVNDDTTAKLEVIEKPVVLPRKDVDDIRDPSHPSLEQVIISTETSRITTVAKENRNRTLNVLRNLTREYQAIMERNKALPKSQQIPQSEFILDDRIVDDLNAQLKAEMDLVYEKMAFKVEKSKLALKKLMDHFVSPLTCLPFGVSRISKPDQVVYSLNEKALEDDFQKTYEEVVEKLRESEKAEKEFHIGPLQKDEDEEESSKTAITQPGIDGVASFMKDQSLSIREQNFTVEIKQMLRKYKLKKDQMEKRAKEWEAMHASKPDPNSDHPDDVRELETAKKTIGDYKLKIAKDYAMTQEKRETTLSKYKQLLDCRKKCHYMREGFNERLKAVRAQKSKVLNEMYEEAEEKLRSIHSEIPRDLIKEQREVPSIDYSLEYPEQNLQMEKYVSMAEKVKEARRLKQSIMEETLQKASDEEYKAILLDENLVEDYADLLPTSLSIADKRRIKDIEIAVPDNVLENLKENDRVITPWEREMKAVRVAKKLYEQDCIIRDMEKSYEEVDKQLDELEVDRLKIYTDSVYSELYKLTLHQELIILRDFEKMEDSLIEKVNKNVEEKTMALQKLQSTMKTIDKRNRDIRNMQNKIKDMTAQFSNAVQDNKYSKFLMKIFKKKVKVRVLEQDASSSQESDSSEDSDSDADDTDGSGSIDLQKIAQTTFDENVCPADCSRELYDLAFSMRLQRHNEEIVIREEQKVIENLLREVDQDSKKIKLIEHHLKECQKTLQDFMYEKQCKLNDIDMTVILKFHQLQHFTDDDGLSKIRDCVVFDTTRLSRLYTRVGELQQDTFDQKVKHQKNCTHLHRMNVDCKFMKSQIKNLKGEIKQEMLKKFGCQVSLGALYESVLRRLIYNMKANMTDEAKYQKQFNTLRKKYNEQIIILESLIKDNTEKLSFLTILTEEQAKLRKIVKKKPQSPEVIIKAELEWREDLAKLEAILANQKQQKDFFRNDVRNLKLKVRTLPPISARGRFLPSFNTVLTKSEEPPPPIKVESAREKQRSGSGIQKHKKDSAFRVVRNLLSKIIQQHVKSEEAEKLVDQFFNEIFSKQSNIPVDFIDHFMEICDKIEKRIEDIANTAGMTDKINEIIVEYANEIISQLEIQSRGVGAGSIEISWNVKPKLDDFLDSLDIKKDVVTEVYLMKFLKMENGLELAIDYILTKLPAKPGSEAVIAFREHATRTLREIQKQINIESETEHEGTPLQSSHSEH